MAVKQTKLKWLLVALFFSASAFPVAESEEELRAIEKAHVAVSEVKSGFRKALTEAVKKGELKNALPGCRIKNLKSDEIIVGRTSHRLRNTNNAAPEWTKPYLEKFAKAERSEIPKDVLTKIGSHRYGYIQPIFVEPICLNCHGRSVKQDVQDAIRELYPQDNALNFDLGDFRGILWLEIKDK